LHLTIDRIEIGHLVVRNFEHDGADLRAVLPQLQRMERKLDNIMATQADFQGKIDTINTNTTASAAAAQAIKDKMAALKVQLDQVLTDAGVPAAVESDILGQLDTVGSTSGALKTFLEETANGPVTAPEPDPVPVPDPVVP
jgi:hypothetical protein